MCIVHASLSTKPKQAGVLDGPLLSVHTVVTCRSAQHFSHIL